MICMHTHSPKKTVNGMREANNGFISTVVVCTAVLWRSKWRIVGFYDI